MASPAPGLTCTWLHLNLASPAPGLTCTCAQDCSPRPLFTAVDPSVGSLGTFSAMAALFDNYLASPGEVEQHTEQEVQEERLFLQEAMATDVMKTTLQFLVDRGQWIDTFMDFWAINSQIGLASNFRSLAYKGIQHNKL